MLKLGLFFLLSTCIQWACLYLIRKQQLHQTIYELSPKRHQTKTKTPSLGGIGICLSVIVGFLWFYHYLIPPHIWILGLFISYAFIGLLDDILNLIQEKNKGLRARTKFGMQVGITLIWLYLYPLFLGRPLSLWEWAFYTFVIVGTANATNLSDGLDGLLAGLGSISFFGFFVLSSALNSLVDASLSIIFMICLLTFLIFNRYPAKIFMGDTGSLAIGAGLAGFAISLGNPWILVPFGAVYILETLSVIVQVSYFKWTRSRIFLMAPLHHHFELLGLSEKNVVRLFWIISFGFIVLYFMLL